jgi:tetratricopeptide (TPR) repeat protein
VLISVLRRCAFSLPVTEIEQARMYFSEALDLARSTKDPEEACMVLEWWANREGAAGSFERALDLASDALRCADTGSQLPLELSIVAWALDLGDFEQAKPHAERALMLARDVEIPLARSTAIAYCAPFVADRDAAQAAILFGYAKKSLGELEWRADRDDEIALQNAWHAIAQRLDSEEQRALLQRGAALTEDEVLTMLDEALSTSAGTPSYAGRPT